MAGMCDSAGKCSFEYDKLGCKNGCKLSGGEPVADGWSGSDTGANHCNSCTCRAGSLACTEMACEPQECCKALTASCLACGLGLSEVEYCQQHPDTQGCPPSTGGVSVRDAVCASKACGDTCTVEGDMAGMCDSAGKCSFEYDKLGCKNGCKLSGGEPVADGWSGSDTGANHCNSCTCRAGSLACTEIACEPHVCCAALIASCLACGSGLSEVEYCQQHPDTQGCPPSTVSAGGRTAQADCSMLLMMLTLLLGVTVCRGH